MSWPARWAAFHSLWAPRPCGWRPTTPSAPASSPRRARHELTERAVARLDGHNHRRVEPDSPLADAVKVTARAHQNLIWTRQRVLNQLRCVLREFYPAALETFAELVHMDCLASLAVAPTPTHAANVRVSTI